MFRSVAVLDATLNLGSQQARGFVTLKEIQMRIKSVTNIQKITKSMKMIAAVKYARAERDLRAARSYGLGARAFYDNVGDEEAEKKPEHLMVLISSDRGLCGGVHSNITRIVKHDMLEAPADRNLKLVIVGDKVRQQVGRFFPNNVLMHASEVGRKPPTFEDASTIAQWLIDTGVQFDQGEIVFNRFKSAAAYITTRLPLISKEALSNSDKLNVYDSVDDDALQSYYEYSLASLVFYAMKEGAASEHSSRMTAMDAASKNAGEMIDKLTLTYNRTRQAVITKELIEIISGAAAV